MPLRRLRPLLLALALLSGAARAQTYVDVIDPAGDPLLHDLEWRDGALWASDRLGDRLIRLDLASGDVLESVAPGFEPVGLAWDGTNWRVSEGFTSTPEVFTVSPAGVVLGQIPAPSPLTNGLAFHAGRLFAANAYPDAGASVVGLDPATGAVLESVAFPSTQPTGIAFTGPNTLWVANAGDDSGSSGVYDVYEIDRTTGAVLRTLAPPPGMTRARGVAYDGSRYLYVTFRRTAVPQISLVYKVDLQAAGNPQIALSATAFDFGPRATGATYPLPLTIQNVGDAPLTLANVEVTSIPENPFGTTLTPQSIPAGGQVTVQVTWAVDQPLRSSGQLTFETNDVNRPVVTIPLQGLGVHPAPTVTFVEGTHDFGPVRVDEPLPLASTGWWPLRIVNLGAQTLTVTGVTFDEPAFSAVAAAFPLALAPADTADVLVEFRPTEARPYAGTATVASNDPRGPVAAALAGTGVAPTLAGGTPLWSWTVPANPATSSSDRKVFAVRVLGDVTGDGRAELAVATRNYWTLVVDVNGWTEPRVVWAYSSCPTNTDCGAVSGNAQLYEYGLEAGRDLNGDGSPDVVIGTEGGSDKVVALDGRTGVPIWTVGSVADPYLASYYSVSLGDVTGDGVADVATGTGSASPESPDPYNHRRVYLLDGATGAELWQAQTALPNFRTTLVATREGLRVVSGGGESASTFVRGYVAATGAVDWTYTPGFSPFLIEPVRTVGTGTDDDGVIVAGLGPLVQRLDAATGAVAWTASSGGTSVWDVEEVERGGGAVPLVVIGSTASDVVAVDAATGLDVWAFPMGGQVFDVAAVPDVDGDGAEDVAATGRAGRTALISGAAGTQIWTHTFGNDTFAQSGETVVAVPDLDGNGLPEVAFGVRDGRLVLLHGGEPTVFPGTEPGTVPAALVLDAPAPNPVRGAARLRYALPAAADVRLALYDALGRQVWRHAAAARPAGTHDVALDAARLAAGVYVLRLEAGGAARTQRVVVAR